MGGMPGTMGGQMMMGGPDPRMMGTACGPTPYGMNRSGIALDAQEMPIQQILDTRTMPMVPTPWAGQPDMLRPAQGFGPDALSPLQQAECGDVQRMPNAYRMYGYGNRVIQWSPQLPVPEPNTGITINAEYPLKWQMEGLEAAPYDSGIRNLEWRHQGPWVQPFDPIHDIPDWKHKLFGQYEGAVDLKRPMYTKDYNDMHYKNLAKQREAKGIMGMDQTAKKRMELEILDDKEIARFFANPEAIMHDSLD